MLTEEEQAFVHYWEANRLKQKRTFRQFLLGIPFGLAIVVPICLNFFSGWYKRADMVSHTDNFNPGILVIAVIIIVVFIAIFSRRFRWEQYEQRYRELLIKKEKQENLEKNNESAAF